MAPQAIFIEVKMFYKNEKLAVLVDGKSTKRAVHAIGMAIDWARVRSYFARLGCVTSMTYLTGIRPESDGEINTLRPLLDYLEYNGWRVITRIGREAEDVDTGRVFLKDCGIHVEFTIAAIRAAEAADHIVMMTSDSSYAPLVKALQDRGKRVTVIACRGISSDAIIRACDNFADLGNLKQAFERQQEA